MRLLSILALAATAACTRSVADPKDKPAVKDKPAMPATKPTTPTQPLALDFTMKKDGGKLRVDYTLANHTKDAYLVQDVMVEPSDGKLSLVPDAAIVVQGASPGQVRFVRGDISPDSKVNIRYPAGVRPLAAGQTLQGSFALALPLHAWHPYGEVNDLEGTPKEAVLDVDVFPATIETTTQKLANGKPQQFASTTALGGQTLHAGPKPLP